MIRFETGRQSDETTEALLASGRADPAIALFLDSVMEMRRAADTTAAAIAGVSLECEAPVAMREDALARAFASIDAEEARPRKKGRVQGAYPELIKIPAVLQEVVARAEAAKGWRSVAPGIRQLPLDMGGSVTAELLRIAPGSATPRHTHKGREATLCLLGGFSDGLGSYGPGDVSLADPSVTHQPRGDDDGVCYVLTVTDAGLAFQGVLGVAQKLFGG